MSSKQDQIAAGSQRLYDADFLGRMWVAEYVSAVDTELDALRVDNERLHEESEARQAVLVQRDEEIEKLRAIVDAARQCPVCRVAHKDLFAALDESPQ